MNGTGYPFNHIGRTDYDGVDHPARSSIIASSAPDQNSTFVAGQPPYASHGETFTEDGGVNRRDSSQLRGHRPNGSASMLSTESGDSLLSRRNTLKKRSSLRRSGSLGRSNSRRSMRAGSVKSVILGAHIHPDEAHSVLHCPVPTSANPTEALANRFQAWRKVLKDLIAYFREAHSFCEQRSKSLQRLADVADNIALPPGFMKADGMESALDIIRGFHKTASAEALKAKEVEQDIILSLTGLRNDLQQKIKEIRNLSGDFKNSVEKEMDSTRRSVKALQDVIGQSEMDSSSTKGKQDPYLLRLAVDRQVWRQLEEENYLHQAYLNLENSGRELESIVVGEIQKSYAAFAGIIKREADAAYASVDMLCAGPIAMPKHLEWTAFIQNNNQFVDTNIPIRLADQLHYPGQDHPSSREIRAGLLERKTKYLKSYTAGWFVLSPTHLHEFKSADKEQAPVMSLYLPDQRLGSHSTEGSSSNKFAIKGRQTGGLHLGHTWVFRAESHDTMMAWYEDIKLLTEATAEERTNLIRGRGRSLSRSSGHSMSSDGIRDDESDNTPFSAVAILDATRRSHQPGGRLPSDAEINMHRGLLSPLSSSSIGPAGLWPDNSVIGAGPRTNEHLSPVTDRNTGHWASLPAAALKADQSWTREGHNYSDINGVLTESVPSQAGLVDQGNQNNDVNLDKSYATESLAGSATPMTFRAETSEIVDNEVVAQSGDVPRPTSRSEASTASQRLQDTTGLYSEERDKADDMSIPIGGEVGYGPNSSSEPTETMNQGQFDRPGLQARTDSIVTISNLPLPGKFPDVNYMYVGKQ